MNAALDENDEAMVEEIGLHRQVVIRLLFWISSCSCWP